MALYKKPTSPIPIKARITSKNGSPILAAIGVRIVAIDHQITPKPNTSLPPILSAQIPPTICRFQKAHDSSTTHGKHQCNRVGLGTNVTMDVTTYSTVFQIIMPTMNKYETVCIITTHLGE